MKTVLFIHGTGVRTASYEAGFSMIQQALNARLGATKVRTEPCLWGESCGSRLFLDGASIPGFEPMTSMRPEDPEDPEYNRGLWATLYRNSEAELQLLALRERPKSFTPGQESPGEELAADFEALWPDLPKLGRVEADRLREALAAAQLLDHVAAAHASIIARASYREALAAAGMPLTEYRVALARALLAESVNHSWDEGTIDQGVALFDGSGRDAIVELLVAALGGKEAGMGWVTGPAKRMFARTGTRWFGRNRGRLSEQMAGFAADVAAYQARPRPIRDFIGAAVDKAADAAAARGEKDGLYLIAHSLGGIAAFESLVERPMAAVAGLITVGSQAPLLYELDALASLPLPKDGSGRPTGKAGALPVHFAPRWINIYDPADFLAYRAEPVFGPERVRDVEVDNGQPFPESHSAYWANPRVWDAVAAFLR